MSFINTKQKIFNTTSIAGILAFTLAFTLGCSSSPSPKITKADKLKAQQLRLRVLAGDLNDTEKLLQLRERALDSRARKLGQQNEAVQAEKKAILKERVALELTRKIAKANVRLFKPFTHTLSNSQKTTLTKNKNFIKKTVQDMPQGYVLALVGHANPEKPELKREDVFKLSEKRAESVYNYITNKFGISEDSIAYKGVGDTAQLLPNKDDSKYNRRVVLKVVPRETVAAFTN